ncbi:MAG: TonB family protein [Chitinispirillaceae bacterium]
MARVRTEKGAGHISSAEINHKKKGLLHSSAVRWILSVFAASSSVLVFLYLIISSDVKQVKPPVTITELDYVIVPAPPREKKKPRKIVKHEPEKQVEKKEAPVEPPPQALPQTQTPSPAPDPSALPSAPVSEKPPVPAASPSKPSGPVSVSSSAQLDNVRFDPLFNPHPVYPDIARSAGIEGFVEVELIISEKGRVETFTVIRVSGHPSFGTETGKVIKRWRFPPPRIDGEAVRVKYVYKVKFRLD